MDLGIAERVALVFGAGSGLGAAIARSLAAEGAKVVAAGRTRESVTATAEAIIAAGGSAEPLVWDLRDLANIDAHVSSIERDVGPIDILIHNTGGPPPTPAAGQDAAVWTEHFKSMILPVISISDRILPGMRSRKWGRIITSTSSGAIAPIPNLAISNTLRLSLLGWSKTLAREVGADGVTCNIVVPGRIATRRVASLDERKAAREGRSVESVIAESTAAIPLGRYGEPIEYASVVTFLASRQAAYITGSVVRVDGGLIPSI